MPSQFETVCADVPVDPPLLLVAVFVDADVPVVDEVPLDALVPVELFELDELVLVVLEAFEVDEPWLPLEVDATEPVEAPEPVEPCEFELDPEPELEAASPETLAVQPPSKPIAKTTADMVLSQSAAGLRTSCFACMATSHVRDCFLCVTIVSGVV